MSNILVLSLGVLGVIVAIVSARSAIRNAAAGDKPALIALAALVLGGLLYEGGLIGTGRPTQIVLLAVVVIALLAQATLSSGESSGRRLYWVAFYPALIALVMFFTNSIHNAASDTDVLLSRFVPVVLWFALGLILCVSGIGLVQFKDLLTMSVAVIAVYIAVAPNPWRACDIFKCGPFGELLTGPFVSENFLAQLAAIAILLLIALPKSVGTISAGILMGLILFATGSRTSQLALAGALCALFIARVLSRERHAQRVSQRTRASTVHTRIAMAILLPTVVIVLGVYLVLTAVPSSFSNRGGIWIRALAVLGPDWTTGLGVERWIAYQEVGLVPLHFPHSEALFLLFGGGVLALTVYWFLLFHPVAISAATADLFPIAFAYAAFLGVTGLTEALWNPITLDGHSFVVIPLVIIGIAGARSRKQNNHSRSSDIRIHWRTASVSNLHSNNSQAGKTVIGR